MKVDRLLLGCGVIVGVCTLIAGMMVTSGIRDNRVLWALAPMSMVSGMLISKGLRLPERFGDAPNQSTTPSGGR